MIFIGYAGNKCKELKAAEKIVINQDLSAAADSFEADFVYNENFFEPSIIEILADNGELLFKGVVDEIVTKLRSSGKEIRLYGRSMAALLLDNEALSVTYREPTPDFIAEYHAKPFGIDFIIDKDMMNRQIDTLTADRGSSHYSVIKKFCSETFGTVPRISGKGVLYFGSQMEGDVIRFGTSDGIRYESMDVIKSRYSRISKVYLVGSSGDITYSDDAQAQECGIVRERYLYESNGIRHSLIGADRLIESGKKHTKKVKLICCDCLIDCVGYNAEVDGEIFRIESVKYVFEGGKEKNEVKMYKE